MFLPYSVKCIKNDIIYNCDFRFNLKFKERGMA